MRIGSGHDDALEFVLRPFPLAMHMSVAPRASVKFDNRGADRFRGIDGSARRLNKQGNAYPGSTQFGGERSQVLMPSGDIETTFRRWRAALLRHPARGIAV